MAKRKEEAPPAGAPAWMATFSDLMNLLLCFFVLLFSMSTVDAQKFELVAASFANTFSIFTAGGQAIGDGMMISNGVSQLNELDSYINSTGKANDSDQEIPKDALEEFEEKKLGESEEVAELVEEALAESGISDEVNVSFNSQYVLLTMNGALLFDSGSAELKKDSQDIMVQVTKILEKYNAGVIEVEGHTDNVPMSGNRYADNDELSSARAITVFKFITANSTINPADIKHSGRGEYVPVADNSTPEGRALNRRVEIKIYNSLSVNQ
ncbi:MAG: flagellar motor protein MotB [Lachnospiraceae bacterium]|nr:flagellar motor protein MotB [Lachnospiraceae bacterium]